jgi:hypothetical protein
VPYCREFCLHFRLLTGRRKADRRSAAVESGTDGDGWLPSSARS